MMLDLISTAIREKLLHSKVKMMKRAPLRTIFLNYILLKYHFESNRARVPDIQAISLIESFWYWPEWLGHSGLSILFFYSAGHYWGLALAVSVPFPAPPPPCDFDLHCLSGLSRASVATERSGVIFSCHFPFPRGVCVASKHWIHWTHMLDL